MIFNDIFMTENWTGKELRLQFVNTLIPPSPVKISQEPSFFNLVYIIFHQT